MLTPKAWPPQAVSKANFSDVVLRQSKGEQKRTLAMVAYFLAYSMKNDEFVDHVNLKEYGFYVNFG